MVGARKAASSGHAPPHGVKLGVQKLHLEVRAPQRSRPAGWVSPSCTPAGLQPLPRACSALGGGSEGEARFHSLICSPACTRRRWSVPGSSHPVGGRGHGVSTGVLALWKSVPRGCCTPGTAPLGTDASAPATALTPCLGREQRTHHTEDGVDHEVNGHVGGRSPVPHWPGALLVVGQQVVGQPAQRGLGTLWRPAPTPGTCWQREG